MHTSEKAREKETREKIPTKLSLATPLRSSVAAPRTSEKAPESEVSEEEEISPLPRDLVSDEEFIEKFSEKFNDLKNKLTSNGMNVSTFDMKGFLESKMFILKGDINNIERNINRALFKELNKEEYGGFLSGSGAVEALNSFLNELSSDLNISPHPRDDYANIRKSLNAFQIKGVKNWTYNESYKEFTCYCDNEASQKSAAKMLTKKLGLEEGNHFRLTEMPRSLRTSKGLYGVTIPLDKAQQKFS